MLALYLPTHSIPLFAYAAASVLALAAAVSDLRARSIPNSLAIATSLIGFGFALGFGGFSGLLTALTGFGAGFVLLLPGYLLGFTGGGDVKLFAALGCFLGPKLTSLAVLLYYPIAGVIALSFIIYVRVRWYWLMSSRLAQESGRQPDQTKSPRRVALNSNGKPYGTFESLLKARLPMAPAIACAVIAAPLLFG